MCKFLLFRFLLLCPIKIGSGFNFEIGQRAHEHLAQLIGMPTKIQQLIDTYRTNKAFPHNFEPPDRDIFLVFGDAMLKTFPHDLIYYGLEDGTFVGHQLQPRQGMYREPGESGYELNNNTATMGRMQKHLNSCVDEAGGDIPCIMRSGESYVECIDDCNVVLKCPDELSQRNCSQIRNNSADEMFDCESSIKWCTSYKIKTFTHNHVNNLGFIPRTAYCVDFSGKPTQTPGENSDLGKNGLGNCYNSNGVTPVHRNISGDFAYCGGGGIICNTTFVGGYQSLNYDPRFRPWYINTKQTQKPNWVDPYFFFYPQQQMGITYSHPIYTTDEKGRSVFTGVLALDFTLQGIASFLTENYKNSDTIVAVVEEAEPNYLIASSTGSTGIRQVMLDNPSQPCPEIDEEDARVQCETVRIPVAQLRQNPLDTAISQSFEAHKNENFPENKLVPSRVDDLDAIYASQTRTFSTEEGIEWKIMILSSVDSHSGDTIMPGEKEFAFLVAPAVIGFVVCSVFLFLFAKDRNQKEFVASDQRLTKAFLLSCALLNAASLSMIGPNTNAMCLTRMWMLNFFFVLTLVPLLLKSYRSYKMVGNKSATTRRRLVPGIPFAMSVVAVELIMLLIFTFAYPKTEELLEYDEDSVTHREICTSGGLILVQMCYQVGLILAGCILSFKTRNIKMEYQDNQQLILAFTNIALVRGLTIVVALGLDLHQGPMRIFISIGIFWSTTFSSCLIVLPRFLRAQARRSSSSITQEGETAAREASRVLERNRIRSELEPIPDEAETPSWAETM
eukprot:CAMPEP_0171354350 /NCGR_PEP_ID=MMETSP0878-20121228/44663_1 /TAXON_ID=67004 /ORGANISM="Thalassiosira weissflogii, Strain CCMP1336" /LENGTH=786 /DNA_ID=CAMNT_0011860323 /DNA_START=248 /DNA_END=2608 /DNA_ORIENTATION=-